MRERLFPLLVIAIFIAMVLSLLVFVNPMVCLGHRIETIDNALESGIIVYRSTGSLRDSSFSLISRWVVKCVCHVIAVVPTMLIRAHVEM